MTRPTAQSRPRPMRQTKLKSLIAKQSPSRSPPSSYAGNRLFFVPEIRQAIFGYLPKPALARIMRVHRGCMKEVAELLYHSVSLRMAQYHMDRTNPRRALYCDAVTLIDHLTDFLPTTEWDRRVVHCRRGNHAQLEGVDDVYTADDESDASSEADGEEKDDWDDWDPERKFGRSRYDAVALEAILGQLRLKLPNLLKLDFGCAYRPYGDPGWSVTLLPRVSPSSSKSISLSAPHFGDVDLIQTRHYDLCYPPPEELLPPPSPSANYTLRTRFDLNTFYPTYPRQDFQDPYHDEWLELLWSDPHVGNIYLNANFDELNVDLELLGHLYQSQTACGHTERLRHITAPDSLPWSVPEFETFAQIASTSLVTLRLCGKDCGYYREGFVGIGFADLPDLVQVVRTDLPNLLEFRFAVEGIEGAEELCASLLSTEKWDQHGSVTSLTVITEEHQTRLFNVLRVLAPMCTPEASIHVSNGKNYEKWSKADQTMFHRYIQAQPADRRFHLATAVFEMLGVWTPWDILDLHFVYGRPIDRRESVKTLAEHDQHLHIDHALKFVLAGLNSGDFDSRSAVLMIQGLRVR